MMIAGAGRLPVEQHVVVHDSVAQAILEVAEAQGADLLAMSTHGRGASRLLVGSMADRLLSHSTLPVLLFRPQHHEATPYTVASFT
jgi:nucleotide-binding universal stress UspA family protein